MSGLDRVVYAWLRYLGSAKCIDLCFDSYCVNVGTGFLRVFCGNAVVIRTHYGYQPEFASRIARPNGVLFTDAVAKARFSE